MSTGVAPVESLWKLGYTDLVLRRFMDAIEARGEWDDALVVVTSDHGEDLQPGHNSRDIRADNQREMVWVPAFVKWPGQGEGVVEPEPHSASELLRIIDEALDANTPEALRAFLATPEGAERHARRVEKIAELERRATGRWVPVRRVRRAASEGEG